MIKNAVSREEVETAIAVVFEEGKNRGMDEAASVYNAALKKIAKRARTGGFILGAITTCLIAVGIQAYYQHKTEEDKKAKEKEKSEEGWI